MGIIDKTTYKLKCEKCQIEEEGSVLDKGSNWSGSSWQGSTNFKNFETKWNGGGDVQPNLTSASCKVCNSDVTVVVK